MGSAKTKEVRMYSKKMFLELLRSNPNNLPDADTIKYWISCAKKEGYTHILITWDRFHRWHGVYFIGKETGLYTQLSALSMFSCKDPVGVFCVNKDVDEQLRRKSPWNIDGLYDESIWE